VIVRTIDLDIARNQQLQLFAAVLVIIDISGLRTELIFLFSIS